MSLVWNFSISRGWESTTDAMEEYHGEDWDEGKLLKEMGYSPWSRQEVEYGLGESDEGNQVVVYDSESGKFLVTVWAGDSLWARVHVPGFPDLLELLARLGPVREMLSQRWQVLGRIEEALQRAFEAWHGHPPWNPCEDCDREEIRRRRDARRIREEPKKAKET